MSSIDERIVKMTFDNSDFEGKISTTLRSLEKLNETLNKPGAADGLKEVNKVLKEVQSQISGMNFDTNDIIELDKSESKLQKFGNALLNLRDKIADKMSTMMDGAEEGIDGTTDSMEELGNSTSTVGQKFSALNSLVQGIFLNLGSKIADFGTKMIKSLTLEPITSGFSEYETKMGSIQTILTNTAHQGTTLKDVNATLAELNTYADKTIYNFAEMTKNIGTFTAAGIDLETSTAAIKGIANLAAASGSSSQQASTAMYQLSQALAAGKVSLMDWNSVVNAGMGGKLFQDALIRTSEVMGTGADEMIKKYGSFRESLTKGNWLTAEVLTETLKQISGAYTEADLIAQGFTQSQAKDIVTLANNASNAATEVKTVTQLLDTMKESVQSGWATSWEHIIGDKEEATKLLTSISKGFENIIGPSTEARNKMLEFWNESGGRDAAIKGFTNIIESMGKGLGAVGDAWKEVFPSMTGEKLTELSTKFRDLTNDFKMSDETATKIKNTFQGVFDVFKTVGSAIGNVVKGFSPLLDIFPTLGSAVLSVTSTVGKFASTVSEALSEKIFNKIGNGLNTAFTFIGDKFETLKTSLGNFFSQLGSMDFSNIFGNLGNLLKPVGNVVTALGEGLGKAIGSINFDAILKGLQTASGLKLAATLKDTFKEIGGISEDVKKVTKSFGDMFKSFGNIGKEVIEVLGTVKESLEAWQRDLQASTLLKIAAAVATLAASLLLLSSINVGQLVTGLAGLGVIFTELALAYAFIAKVGGIKGTFGIATSLVSMSSSMLILAGALKILSTISIEEMVTGLLSLAIALTTMVVAVKLFDKAGSGLGKTSASLITFGAALIVMAGALQLLGSIDTETLGSGLFALGAVLLELSAFLALAKFGSLNASTAGAVLILAGGLVVLSQAVALFGDLDVGQILKGITGIASILTVLTLFEKSGVSGANLLVLSAGLTTMSVAMAALSLAMKAMGSISWGELAVGLTALAGALTVLGVASAVISGTQMMSLAAGVTAMSVAMGLLAVALDAMGQRSWSELGISLVTLASSLTILTVAMHAMTGCLPGAAAMLVMAAAMAVFTPQLMALSSLSWGELAVGITALAGAFAVLGVAGLAATAIAPGLTILAAAILAVGTGAALAGVGMSAFGVGFGLVAAAIGASGLVIIEFIRQLIGLLPQIGLKAGEAMVNFASAIAKGAPEIIEAFTAILDAILTTIQNNIPKIAETGVDIVVALAEKLAEGVPKLVQSGIELFLGILKGIRDNIHQMVDVALQIVTQFINAIAANIGSIIQSGINLALSFIEGVADGLLANQARIESAISKVIQALIKTGISVIKGGISGFTSGGRELLQGLCNGISSMMSAAGTAVTNCINAAKRAASNLGSSLVSAGKSLIQGLINGITSMASSVASKARSVVEGAINAAKNALKINSPSKVFIEIGKYTDEGFIVGLEKYSSRVAKAATGVANNVVDNFSRPLSAINSLIDSDVNVNPVITPVLDLSNVQANSRRLNSMIPGSGNIALSTDAANIMTSSMGTVQNGVSNSEVVSAIKDLKNNMPVAGNTSYNINGITYDDGSNIVNAVETLVRAARIERRI